MVVVPRFRCDTGDAGMKVAAESRQKKTRRGYGNWTNGIGASPATGAEYCVYRLRHRSSHRFSRYFSPATQFSTNFYLAIFMKTQQIPPQSTGGTFSDRIRLLIQHFGSATEIARKCGFSEGVVRSWRDGNTDPSRARCVTLARTLGISLVWLVAGEGVVQSDALMNQQDEQHSGEIARSQRPHSHLSSVTQLPVSGPAASTWIPAR